MTTQTLTLTEFLLARIAGDEGAAGQFPEPSSEAMAETDYLHFTDPNRVLDDCESKRRIVELLGGGVPDPHLPGEDCNDCQVLYLMALPYADHPDYRDEWRP